jgi:hypothetical protein
MWRFTPPAANFETPFGEAWRPASKSDELRGAINNFGHAQKLGEEGFGGLYKGFVRSLIRGDIGHGGASWRRLRRLWRWRLWSLRYAGPGGICG